VNIFSDECSLENMVGTVHGLMKIQTELLNLAAPDHVSYVKHLQR